MKMGQLGDGVTQQSNVPVQVRDLTGIVTVASGFEARCGWRACRTV